MKAPSIYNMSMWSDTVYNLDSQSMDIFDEITEMLSKVKPMRSNNNYIRIWLSEERGTVADMRFTDVEEAKEYFEADSEAELNSAFLNQYPQERYWFMLESLHNEDCRILRLKHLSFVVYDELPDHVDNTPYNYADFLEWVRCAVAVAIKQAEQGLYLDAVEKELPYNLRYGTISRKALYRRRPSCKETELKDLTDSEIDRFIETIEHEGDNYIPECRIKDMTFDMYFDYASKAFAAAGYDIAGLTPYEQFRRYGEDFGGRLLERLPHDTTNGFLYYYDDKHHMGGHPWGLVRGSSRTRIFLWPRLTEDGFYFRFSGNEVFMAYEIVKMYLALKDRGLPVTFSGNKSDVIKYLRQDDLIGIVPSYELALYHQHEFPNLEVEDFMHFDPAEDADISDLINWQPIMPIVFKEKAPA